MKVLVTAKRVIDPYVKVRVKSDGTGVETANVKMVMNPFCEIAVEQAVRMKEAGIVTEIVVVSVGTQQSQERLRTAMAMGADRGILVEVAGEVQPLAVAKLVKAIVDKEQPNLVIMGKQAIDDDSNQAGQMTVALLDWPQSAFTSAIAVNGDTADVTREIDGGLKKLTIKLPAVVPCSLQAIPIKSREVRQFMENNGHEEEQIPMYSCSYMKYARRAHPSFIFCLA